MRRPARLALGLLVSTTIFALVEITLRVALGPPPPPVRIHSGIQSIEQYFTEQDGTVTAVYHGLLRRGTFPAEHNTTRIAVLGGSSVEGGTPGLPDEWYFARLLGERLGVTSVNLGSPGLDSHDLVRIVEELSAWRFDAVVVYTGHNDLGNTWFHQRYGTLRAGLAMRTQQALEHLQIYTLLRWAVAPTWLAAGNHDNVDGERLSDARRAVALRHYEANLRRIAWLAERQSSALVLVTPVSQLTHAPVDRECADSTCPVELHRQGMDLRGHDPDRSAALLVRARDADHPLLTATTESEQIVRAVAAETGATLVDAVSGLPRADGISGPAPDLFLDRIHFSQRGHKAMARLLAPAVAESLELPAPR